MSTSEAISVAGGPSPDDQAAVAAVPGRIVAAWAQQDPAGFAGAFTEDATLILPGNVMLKGRTAIQSFMTQAFAGPYKGTNVYGEPVDVRALNADTAVIVTQGGVLAPGEKTVAPERAIWATWVIVRDGGDWRIAAYQNTPKN